MSKLVPRWVLPTTVFAAVFASILSFQLLPNLALADFGSPGGLGLPAESVEILSQLDPFTFELPVLIFLDKVLDQERDAFGKLQKDVCEKLIKGRSVDDPLVRALNAAGATLGSDCYIPPLAEIIFNLSKDQNEKHSREE